MGTIKKQAVLNTIISYAGIGIGFLSLLVLQPIMLSPEELGLTRIMYSVSIMIATLFPIGLNQLTIRYFPVFKNPLNGHNGYKGLLFLISTITYTIAVALIFIFKENIIANYKNSPLFVQYFNYILPMSWCIGMVTLIMGYLGALFKTTVPNFLNEIYIRIAFILILTLYFFKFISFDVFMILFVLTYGSQLVLLLIYLIKMDGFNLKINWNFYKALESKALVSYTIAMAFTAFASISIRSIDVIFIGKILDLKMVGVYSIAFTIGSLIEAPANALGKIADPKISDAISRHDNKLIQTIYFKSTRILMIIGGILFVGVAINVFNVVSLLPEKFHGCENVVLIIGVNAFFNMATGINASLLVYSHRYRTVTYLLYLMIAMSIALNYFLIPIYGIEGAAIATGSSLLLFNFLKFLVIWQEFKMQPFGFYVLQVLFLMGFCLGINYFLPHVSNVWIDMFYRSVIITLVYGLGVILFRLIPNYMDYVNLILSKVWKQKS